MKKKSHKYRLALPIHDGVKKSLTYQNNGLNCESIIENNFDKKLRERNQNNVKMNIMICKIECHIWWME